QRNDLALLHQPRGGDDVLGAGVVERADLVVRTPLAPVLVLLGGGAHVLARDFLCSHLVFLFLYVLSQSTGADRKPAARNGIMLRKARVTSPGSQRPPVRA